MTKLEMLRYGMQHIANNHGVGFAEEDGEVCVYGKCNVPLLADVVMLCSDVGIGRDFVESGDCGIDVWFPEDWDGKEEYKQGLEFWRKKV